MCGIGGIVLRPASDVADLVPALTAMGLAMRHRGPDDEGVHVTSDGRAGLVNRRLAVRDPSPAGHMPMPGSSGAVQITYNGEIYNADELRAELRRAGCAFRSHGDTEVILKGYETWGEAVLERLRGMFAFGILDLRPSAAFPAGRLWLARDHLGVKPLYYANTPRAFVFASELRGLRASGFVADSINPTALVGYLLSGSVPAPHTILRGATALEPACALSISLDGSGCRGPAAYWRLPSHVEPSSAEAAADRVRELLSEAVRISLVSDVPLGVFLSGGLDSSAVAALATEHERRTLRTCSVVFEESEFSEAQYARAMSESLGAEHYERVVRREDLLDEWEAILAAMDQPTVDGVNTYFVAETARRAGLTVALSGLGGDELFGGYRNTFRHAGRARTLARAGRVVPRSAELALAAVRLLPIDRRWMKAADALARPATAASAYAVRRGVFAPTEVRELVTPELWDEATREFDWVDHVRARADAAGDHDSARSSDGGFAWTSRAELRTYTHDQLLRDTDVMSMAHSLEVRVPLLDVRLVEAVLTLPAHVKREGAGSKPLIARAVGALLPDAIRRRRKHGFTLPFDRWVQEILVRHPSSARRAAEAGLHPRALDRVRTLHAARKAHWSKPWALFVAQEWLARAT